MKFAHEFKAALLREGFPPHWVNSAIPYGQLKKCIKKVESELRSIGLDSTTLANLVPVSDENPETRRASAVAFNYDFDGDKEFRPKLTLLIRVEDGFAVDAALSKDTRRFLKKLASNRTATNSDSVESTYESSDEDAENHQLGGISTTKSGPLKPGQTQSFQRVEVPLTFDTEFFEVLQGDVSNLDSIQELERESLANEIVALSTEVSTVAKPSKYTKSDMYRWRELFELYLDASPFFSTRESDSGRRNSTTATKQLQWFQSEVVKRGLVQSFKLSASRQAFDRFVAINIILLQNLSFQEINQKAVTKILKKFDKRTKLGATRTFPMLIQSDLIMSETMAKAVCAQMSSDIIKVVPQIDDYLCPICFTIAWRPIRMQCMHVFCIRCTVLMQREKKRLCPLCRGDVMMKADTDSIDADLVKFLRKYFPKETKEKQIAIETADGIEQFGIYYKHPSEYSCAIM